jgi:hypothetical protein
VQGVRFESGDIELAGTLRWVVGADGGNEKLVGEAPRLRVFAQAAWEP